MYMDEWISAFILFTTLSTNRLHWKDTVHSISDCRCGTKAKVVSINGGNVACHCDVCILEVVCCDIIVWGLELRDVYRNLISRLRQIKLTGGYCNTCMCQKA